jgi:DNA-binding transcriptional MerR regulator
MTETNQACYSSGEVARIVKISRWKLLYFIESGIIPEPTLRASNRRLFTEEEIENIVDVLAARAARRR